MSRTFLMTSIPPVGRFAWTDQIMLRNILAILAGLIVGGVVNMALVMVSGFVIPPPAGADTTTAEGLTASIHLFEAKHFIFPFLAHALGTLAGAFIGASISKDRKFLLSMVIGAFFLVGGIVAAWMIPAPLWFEAFDVLLAYLPMAWIGWKFSGAGNNA